MTLERHTSTRAPLDDVVTYRNLESSGSARDAHIVRTMSNSAWYDDFPFTIKVSAITTLSEFVAIFPEWKIHVDWIASTVCPSSTCKGRASGAWDCNDGETYRMYTKLGEIFLGQGR